VSDPGRDSLIEQFLAANGFALSEATPLAQDASFRRYLRLRGGAILMDSPPPEDVGPFLRIAAHLAGVGLAVPRILAADEANGLIIEEDLGDGLFAAILTEANAEPLLDAAIDALVALHRAAPPSGVPAWGKPAMLETALGTLFDWWWPATHGASAPQAARAEVTKALAVMLDHVEAGPRALVHRDFFAGNLIWLPDRTGPRRAGIIDFQSAAIGHPAYDLVSLLQDARRDIDPAWEERAVGRYLAARPEFDPATFRAAYAACAAQRHLRVACQWVRLARRDGRPQYLAYGPRTWRLLTRALTEVATAPLADALDRWVPREQRRNPPGLFSAVIPGLDPGICASTVPREIPGSGTGMTMRRPE
jgi:aminoglycoside/choline kinase family phosphotransferase